MENNKVNAVILQYKDFIPSEQILMLKHSLSNASETCYDDLIAVPMTNPTTTILLSVFLGGFGIDRFYIGDTGLGIAKLLVGWLTFGIWPLVDIFCCYKKAKKNNLEKLLLSLR